jgi:hypothetical protein
MVVKKQKTEGNYFDIRSLILKGKADVRTYDLGGFPVSIRPLTDLEFEECEMAMLEQIKDPATRRYAFEASPSQMSNVDEKPEVDYTINYNELIRASTTFLLTIAYLSMRDFTDSFEIEDLKKINGIRDLALEVQRISGYHEQTITDIEDFRQE